MLYMVCQPAECCRIFGIGEDLTASPSHTTVRTGHVYGGSADGVNAHSRLPVHADRSVCSCRANVGFIPATRLAPHGLAGCSASVPWQATSPLFQSPLGEPFGPSASERSPTYALCKLLPYGQRQLLSAQPISLAREIPRQQGRSPRVRHRTFRAKTPERSVRTFPLLRPATAHGKPRCEDARSLL